MELSPFDRVVAIAGTQWGMFTTQQGLSVGFTRDQLRWQARTGGPFERVERSVYRLRDASPHRCQLIGAALLGRGQDAVACGRSAGWAMDLDGVDPGRIEMAIVETGSHRRPGVRRRRLEPHEVVPLGPFRMTSPLTTLFDLAVSLDDQRWEWCLESALRKPWVTIDEVHEEAQRRSRARMRGAARARRVLALRPPGAKATGSQLETEFLQLIRPVPEIPEPVRQYPVLRHGRVEARLDFAFPELHAYTEVLGSQHRESLDYDANRETLVAATKGWLASEVTKRQIRNTPRPTIAWMIEFIGVATRRALATGRFGV